MTQKRCNQINFIISALLLLAIGALGGYTIGFVRASIRQFPDLEIVEDTNEGVATIKLLEVKNGQLMGETAGQGVRLAYSTQNILELPPESAFAIPLNQIDLKSYYQARDLPPEALYIASRQGKYYYSIFDSKAYKISEKNRLYFSSKEEAEAQGYKAK